MHGALRTPLLHDVDEGIPPSPKAGAKASHEEKPTEPAITHGVAGLS